jgi:hypothetical protein
MWEPHPLYASDQFFAHNFSGFFSNTEAGFYRGGATDSGLNTANTDVRMVPGTTYQNAFIPDTPQSTASANASQRYGDFDNGPGDAKDGAYINKPDEGGQDTGGGGYFGLGGPGQFNSFGAGVQGFPLFGTGSASWTPLAQPGKIQGSNRAYEGAHSAQVHSVLSDPSLTMEDKIMLALMLICSKMDEDIKRQTEYLNQLQNQQGARNKKGGALGAIGGLAGTALGGPVGGMVGSTVGGKLGGGGQDGEKSIDLETKKLERMIQKRAQLFDTLSKIMERYDQSAKNVIQSMRG